MPKKETQPVSWNLISLKTRIDAGSFDELQDALRNLRLQGKSHIALDMRMTKFLSLPAIQLIVSIAHELKEQDGEMVLVGPTEKAKKHFEIYGTLKNLRVIRNGEALDLLANHEGSLNHFKKTAEA